MIVIVIQTIDQYVASVERFEMFCYIIVFQETCFARHGLQSATS